MFRSMYQTIKDVILRDTTKSADESVKLLVALRILCFSMILYLCLDLLSGVLVLERGALLQMLTIRVISLAVFVFVFFNTFRQKTMLIVFELNGAFLLWTIANVVVFGWNEGYQQFLMLLIVLCFFSSYRDYVFKMYYAGALIAIRLYLSYFCNSNTPIYVPVNWNHQWLQGLNTLYCYFGIAVVAYCFSRDSQKNEEKLMDERSELQGQANRDPLTGLYNRRKATEYLEAILKPDAESCACVCICDIDFFKKVNDTYGHNIGDVVLQILAQTMKVEIGDKGIVARWGGEEFLIVFPNANGDEAFFLLDQLRQKIKRLEFDGGSETFHVSMTFGLQEYDFQETVPEVIKEADDKLYLGKENGRDRIVF